VDWPVSIGELGDRFAELETLFHLPAGPFELESDPAADPAEASFVLRSAKWPQFRWRNIAHLLKQEIQRPDLEIWLDATVTSFQLRGDGKISTVRARAPCGSELSVSAGLVVIAAGAIESTRLMLLLDAQHDYKLFRPHQLLGRYFFDHMSAPAAKIEPPLDRTGLNETFGIRFERSAMRDVRMEPSADLRRRAGLPAGFAHVTATSPTKTGFDSLREIYRDLQSGAALDWLNVLGVGKDLGWFLRAAWWRVAKRRLLAAGDAQYRIMMVTEQFPNRDSRITLSDDRSDAYGTPMARIDWQTTERDSQAFRALQAELANFWAQSPFRHLGRLALEPEDEWRPRLQSSSDIFHPGGTTRMGRDPKSGVVDAGLRSFQVENLYVVSTSAFPSGGGANPTFTLMALALRAADRIAAEASRR
jgi:choline dehydrogenase-like flavoprotein